MSVTPKDLNHNNSGYGYKELQHQWRDAILPTLDKLIDLYNNGGYGRVIEEGVEFIKWRVKSISDLPKMNEAHLAAFYLVGKAYLSLGQVDNAIAFLQVAHSQSGFEKKMLSSPHDFSGFVGLAGKALQEIAIERGEDYVNGVRVETIINERLGKSGGCFIATATYGSPLAPEVLTFRRFRDETLLSSRIGAAAAELYYTVSPPLAALIAKSSFLRAATRKLLLEPILRLLKSSSSFKS